MKKICSLVFALAFIFLLVGCNDTTTKKKDNKLYFDWTGIAETTHIAYTNQDTFDLKTVFKVGNKTSSYGEKKIGETTYDDIFYYIYSWGSSEYLSENDDAKIDSDGIVTKKRLSTVVIYAALKEVPTDISENEKANEGMHILTLFFGNDKTFGTWEAPNDYLDVWIQDKIDNGETDAKKATITFEFRNDFSYTLTVTSGYWGTNSTDLKLRDDVITGKLYGSSSSGAVRRDDKERNDYSFSIEMNKYGMSYDEVYTLFTGYRFDYNSNSWNTVRFIPKESSNS